MLVDGASVRAAASTAADLIRHHGIVRVKDKPPVWNCPIAFDTETTNYTYDDGEEHDVGWLYIWMLRIGDPMGDRTEFFYGRTATSFDMFLSVLAHTLSLGDVLLLIFVQNLGFDLEYIRDRLTITHELHAETHEPIFVRDSRGIEFRDSKILAGGLSLKRIGEELDNGLVKRSGDLDYDLIRTPATPLTEEEMGYCQGDVDVLASYIQKQIRLYKGLQHVPMTNTGRVRKYARDTIYGRVHKGAKARYRELMDECVLTYEEYLECKAAFAGGYTHANSSYVGKVVKDVLSYDFTSSYPAVMLSERFPMGRPEHVGSCTDEEFRAMVNDPECCIIFDVLFGNIRVKEGSGDCYLTNDASKCTMRHPVAENGRIRECERYSITMTDVDFRIVSKCYEWDEMEVSNILKWRADYLPSPIIGIVLDLYDAKTTLKGVDDRRDEYMIKKGMLNSMYGMCVTRILRDKVEVKDGSWVTIPLTEDEMHANIEKNNRSMNRFLYYPWGVYITAYARFNLWTAILTLGNDYIYSDTDSIKVFADSEKLKDYLERYHHDLRTKFSWMIEKRRKFTMEDLSPKDIRGRSRPIGEWDYEGRYELFKTLGSKRYMTYDGAEVEPTVAGIAPNNLKRFLSDTCRTVDSMFDAFNDGLHVPQEYTGKLASVYYENVDMTVKDYLGQPYHVTQRYGVHLKPVDFTLTMTGSFIDLVKMIQGVM